MNESITEKSEFQYPGPSDKAKARLGAFAGMSNNPFVENPDNIFTPIFGIDFEAYDENASRHSIAFGFKPCLQLRYKTFSKFSKIEATAKFEHNCDSSHIFKSLWLSEMYEAELIEIMFSKDFCEERPLSCAS